MCLLTFANSFVDFVFITPRAKGRLFGILVRGFDIKNTEFNTRRYRSLEATQLRK